MSEDLDRDELNIGELADDNLGRLTPVEELLEDLQNDREVYDYQIEQSIEYLQMAQDNSAEILRRFEQQVAPVGEYLQDATENSGGDDAD